MKKPKTGWAYYQTIEACTPEEAKSKVIAENSDIQNYKLAVYPKRWLYPLISAPVSLDTGLMYRNVWWPLRIAQRATRAGFDSLGSDLHTDTEPV